MIGAIPTEVRGPKRKVGTKGPLRCAEREGSEEAKYASICVSVLANPKPYMASGIFDLSVFWSGQKSVIPVHYSLWMAEVGCAKVASANVETVDDDPFIVLTETKFSFRCIPVWIGTLLTGLGSKKNTCDNVLTMTSKVPW